MCYRFLDEGASLACVTISDSNFTGDQIIKAGLAPGLAFGKSKMCTMCRRKRVALCLKNLDVCEMHSAMFLELSSLRVVGLLRGVRR